MAEVIRFGNPQVQIQDQVPFASHSQLQRIGTRNFHHQLANMPGAILSPYKQVPETKADRMST